MPSFLLRGDKAAEEGVGPAQHPRQPFICQGKFNRIWSANANS
jgi:hypothetical protein